MSRIKDNQQLRKELAVTAARIMVEESLDDYYLAKRKAAHRLGVDTSQQLPSNEEIEAELRLHQSIFHPSEQVSILREMRHEALDAMRFFESFQPKLTGAVLDGTATKRSTITLHLFTDQLEEIDWFLMDRKIPYELSHVVFRMKSGGDKQRFPAFRFFAGEIPIELVVFPKNRINHAPISPVNGKPMERVNAKRLQKILTVDDLDVN